MILIIVIVVIVLLPIVLGAMFFGIGTGFGATYGPPAFGLGPIDQSNGNASLLIYAFEPLDPTQLRFNLTANGHESPTASFPSPDGFADVVVGGGTLRLFWIDPNHDGFLGYDDVLWITGDRAPLPAATTFRLTLQTTDGSTEQWVTWTTGPA